MSETGDVFGDSDDLMASLIASHRFHGDHLLFLFSALLLKSVLFRAKNRKDLFHLGENHIHKSSSALFNEKKVKSATCLDDIEDGLLRHFDGHSSTYEYMLSCGCEEAIRNIDIPLLLVNSKDDPLIINEVHDIPVQYAQNNEKALFITTKHGGHLGFFKGGWWVPDDITMIEYYVTEYIEAVLAIQYPKGRELQKNPLQS